MLIIPIKEGENIDRALKRFKRKFDKTGAMKQLRTRKQFTKPSVKHRQKFKKLNTFNALEITKISKKNFFFFKSYPDKFINLCDKYSYVHNLFFELHFFRKKWINSYN